jgi:hypothetical protein
MSLKAGMTLMTFLWMAGVFLSVAAWKRTTWIERYYERKGFHSTKWWAWPHNTGKSINLDRIYAE